MIKKEIRLNLYEYLEKKIKILISHLWELWNNCIIIIIKVLSLMKNLIQFLIIKLQGISVLKKIKWLLPYIIQSYNQTIGKYMRYIKKSKGYKHRLTAYYYRYKKHPNKSAFRETTMLEIAIRLQNWWRKTRKTEKYLFIIY
jgi:hypothetical protein